MPFKSIKIIIICWAWVLWLGIVHHACVRLWCCYWCWRCCCRCRCFYPSYSIETHLIFRLYIYDSMFSELTMAYALNLIHCAQHILTVNQQISPFWKIKSISIVTRSKPPYIAWFYLLARNLCGGGGGSYKIKQYILILIIIRNGR